MSGPTAVARVEEPWRASPPRPRQPRRRAAVIAVVALVVAGAAGFIGVRSMLAAADRDQVRIVTDASALTCEGTSVELQPSDQSDGSVLAIPIAPIEADMRCDFTFWVSNRGDRSVRLDRISFPLLGPGGGAAVEAVGLSPLGIAPNSAEAIDLHTGTPNAIFETDLDLPPGSATDFTLHLEHRPSSCSSPGSTISFPNTPTITITARGISGDRRAEHPGFGFRSHPTLNDCDGS